MMEIKRCGNCSRIKQTKENNKCNAKIWLNFRLKQKSKYKGHYLDDWENLHIK